LPTNGVADELALEMLGHLLDDLPIVVEVAKGRMLASELVSLVQGQGVSVICLADLPPSPPSKTRYLVKRLHAALPEVRILVGRWGPRALADDSTQLLRDAGATLVASTLTETRTYLGGLVKIPHVPLPASSVQAACDANGAKRQVFGTSSRLAQALEARREERVGTAASRWTVPTIVPETRQNSMSRASASQLARSGKQKTVRNLRGNRRWSRGGFPFSKPPYAALWKSSIWRIQLVSGFHLGKIWATIPSFPSPIVRK
jgi:hypothetical protein